jgi:hypothetical protein
MKPYTMTFTAEEALKIQRALRSGAFYANLFAATGTDGDKEKAEQIIAAVELIGNKQFEGGYESDAERNAAALESFAEECRIHGSN